MLPLLRFYCPKWLDNGQISSQSKLKQSFSMNKKFLYYTFDKAEEFTRFYGTIFRVYSLDLMISEILLEFQFENVSWVASKIKVVTYVTREFSPIIFQVKLVEFNNFELMKISRNLH